MESKVQGLLNKLLPVLVGELNVATSWNNGDKLSTHALALKGLNGDHLCVCGRVIETIINIALLQVKSTKYHGNIMAITTEE